MKIGKRVKLFCSGRPHKSVLLTAPPYPEIGDPVTFAGIRYFVLSVEDEQYIPLQITKKKPDEPPPGNAA